MDLSQGEVSKSQCYLQIQMQFLRKVSFAKGKMLGAGRHPTGPKWGE